MPLFPPASWSPSLSPSRSELLRRRSRQETRVRADRSSPDLSVAVHDPVKRGQRFETHGPGPVQLARRNPDFGAEPEFAAVVETCARVDNDASSIDFVAPARRVGRVIGADRFGMARAV